jgi:hypothetical protein
MAIDAFRRRIAAEESDPHPLPKFHHCSFLGLVGHGRSRVGCLLHPMGDGNEGIDFRGLSEYGGWACRSYFCPTHRRVRATHLEMVRNVLSHWYEYGLVVTEWKMLGHLFAELETWCETPLRWSDISENAACREILVELLTLKLSWPFRADADQPPVHYFFNDRLYSKPKTGGSAIGNDRSPLYALFYELHSVFVSRRQLHEAEAIVHRLLSRFRRHYR